jgi:hypothetical protein
MWIGSIRLIAETKDAPNAGTDSLVQATVIRDGADLRVLNLDYPTEDDLERGAIRNYDYSGPTKLPRRNDQTPELPPGIGQNPMPYPGYGFEYSNGLNNHLKLRLRIRGDDMWIKDNVDFTSSSSASGPRVSTRWPGRRTPTGRTSQAGAETWQ